MKVLIIYCHPSKNSFTYEVKEAFIKGLERAGHSYEISDLYADGFNPVKSGSYLCREIIGYDISTEKAKKYAREHHLYANCHEMVGNAVDALEEILQKNKQ